MFPIPENINESLAEESTRERSEYIGRDLKFDFERNMFVISDGAVKENITEDEKIEQWFRFMLTCIPGKFRVYRGTPYGVDTESLIGMRNVPYGFIFSEIKREIEEASALNPHIDYVDNFDVKRDNGTLSIGFTAHMYTGREVEVNV